METREKKISKVSPWIPPDTDVPRSCAWNKTFWQFFRYCLVGGMNTLIDVFILNVLLWGFPTTNVLVLIGDNSIAYMSGAISSFFFNKYWTFGHTQRMTWREVLRFVITLFFEVLYSNVLIWLAGKALQPFIINVTLWGNVSKLVAVVGGTIISYCFMRYWTFASGPRTEFCVKEQSEKIGSQH
jgi:putative flippase GtrA